LNYLWLFLHCLLHNFFAGIITEDDITRGTDPRST
jgi:hypothetical protein